MGDWAMDRQMKTELVSAALKQAIGRTGAPKGVLIHSDRGVQYASKDYQQLLGRHGFVCSMSRKGNCYDNAPMESFWGKLKMEWLNDCTFKTRNEAKYNGPRKQDKKLNKIRWFKNESDKTTSHA